MNSDDSSIIIIDPVLCYVKNHWKTVSDRELRAVISRYFDDSTLSDAYDRLKERIAPFLDGLDNEDDEDGLEAILRIFRLCDRYRIILPEFAVTDLKSLPPAPSPHPVDLESAQSGNNSSSDGAREASGGGNDDDDAAFTRRTLLGIVKELKQLKSLVIDLSLKKSVETSTIGVDYHQLKEEDEEEEEEEEEEEGHPSPEPANEEEENKMHAVGGSTTPPPPNGDDPKPPSRDSNASISRAAMTPPRKRGSSRSSSSIEDAVAKIKARGGNPLSLLFQGGGSNAQVEPTDSGSPSPKQDNVMDQDSMPTCGGGGGGGGTPVYCETTTTQVKNECDASLFPSALAARSLAAAMMEPGLFSMSRLDLVNSAAAMMAATGVFPVSHGGMLAAALSPRTGRGLPPFASTTTTTAAAAATSLESCFAAPTPTTPCVSPLVKAAARPTINAGLQQQQQLQKEVVQKAKKTASKRQDLASPTMSEPDETRKRQHQEHSDGDSSMAESSSGGQGNGTGKPYVCTHENCRKRFSNKFLLKKHEFIHTGLRPHQCPYCLKKFNRKDNLLRHKVTHEKNYTTPRRRSCRVFGVKGSMGNSSRNQAQELITASAGSSPSTIETTKICVQQRSASCAPSEQEMAANRQATPITVPVSVPTPSQTQPQQQPPQGTFHTSTEFSLAALASYTALAQSLWPRAAMSGVHSMNN